MRQALDPFDVLVTVPAHNESGYLDRTIRLLVERLDATGWNYGIAVTEDGSVDDTREIAQRLGRAYEGLLVVTDEQRRGRGFALRRLWSSVAAKVYAFSDADLPGGSAAVVEVVREIMEGADVASASRLLEASVTNRPPLRHFVSLVYNKLVRLLFNGKIRDYQCGIKAFSGDAAQRLIPLSQDDTWFWDTEVLILASRLGMEVREIPITWTESRYRRTSLRRLFSDFTVHGRGLLRLRERVPDFVGGPTAARSREPGPVGIGGAEAFYTQH